MTGLWVHPWFEVTKLFSYLSLKIQCYRNQCQEWTRALSDLVLEKTTLSFEDCEKSVTFGKMKN